MELLGLERELDGLLALDPHGLGQAELAAHTLTVERIRCAVDAIQMRNLVAAHETRVEQSTRHRRTSMWIADKTGAPTGVVTGRINTAQAILCHAPAVWAAYLRGDITGSHIRRISETAQDKRFCDQLTEDQGLFIMWATTNKWPRFAELVTNWELLHDRTNPADLAAAVQSAADQRALTIRKTFDGQVIIEVHTTAALGEQFEDAVDATYQKLFNEDWAWVKETYGPEACMAQMPRSRKQRFHDAHAMVIRAGYAQLDPGADLTTQVILDEQTMHDAANRAEGKTPPQRPSTDAETMRCETRRGTRIPPQQALAYLLIGHVRSLKLSAVTLEASRKNRYFAGLQRLAMLVRDPYCAGAGCPTRSHHCQGDHVVPHSQGGETADANAQPLCGPCHRYKTWLETHGIRPPPSRAPT